MARERSGLAAARALNRIGIKGLYDLPGGRALLVPNVAGGWLHEARLVTVRGDRTRYLSAPPSSLAPLARFETVYSQELLPVPATEPVEVRRARVVGRDGAALEPTTGRVFIESVCSRPWQLQKLRELKRPRLLRPALDEREPLVVLASFNSENYYHFLTDVLTRLYAFSSGGTASLAALRERVAGIEFVLDAHEPEWQRGFAALLGLRFRVEPLHPGTNRRVDRLIVPPTPSFYYERGETPLYARDAVRWLGQVLRDAVGAEAAGPQRRLYLTRRQTNWRRLTNEHELEPLLREQGFEVVSPELLPVAEQIRLFADAEIVVAPHGSALTNILFARRCIVVEIVNPEYPSVVFYPLADALGHDYWYIAGERRDGRGGALDYACDVDLLAATLEGALRR